MSKGDRRDQAGRCFSRSRRRQRQRDLPRRAARNLLPDDLHALQQPAARMGPGRATQSRPKLHGARSEQCHSDKLKKTSRRQSEEEMKRRSVVESRDHSCVNGIAEPPVNAVALVEQTVEGTESDVCRTARSHRSKLQWF